LEKVFLPRLNVVYDVRFAAQTLFRQPPPALFFFSQSENVTLALLYVEENSINVMMMMEGD
jgi:hypothetical protein